MSIGQLLQQFLLFLLSQNATFDVSLLQYLSHRWIRGALGPKQLLSRFLSIVDIATASKHSRPAE